MKLSSLFTGERKKHAYDTRAAGYGGDDPHNKTQNSYKRNIQRLYCGIKQAQHHNHWRRCRLEEVSI